MKWSHNLYFFNTKFLSAQLILKKRKECHHTRWSLQHFSNMAWSLIHSKSQMQITATILFVIVKYLPIGGIIFWWGQSFQSWTSLNGQTLTPRTNSLCINSFTQQPRIGCKTRITIRMRRATFLVIYNNVIFVDIKGENKKKKGTSQQWAKHNLLRNVNEHGYSKGN